MTSGAGALGPLSGLLAPFANPLKTWDYRPSTSWFQHFITTNNNAGDAAVEEKVLSEVGSYGYRTNRILDAVDLLVGELKSAEPGHGQQRIVLRLQDLALEADVAANRFTDQATHAP